MTAISNFRLVNDYNEKPPYLDEIENIEGFKMYHSKFNDSIYIIHDEEKEIYVSIEYMSMDVDVMKHLNNYVSFYKKTNNV